MEHAKSAEIDIGLNKIDTKEQLTIILTKRLSGELFRTLRKKLMG